MSLISMLDSRHVQTISSLFHLQARYGGGANIIHNGPNTRILWLVVSVSKVSVSFRSRHHLVYIELQSFNLVNYAKLYFYRAMHFSAFARCCERMSSVCPSVRPSVTLVICDHIDWKSWKLIAWAISPTSSLLAAKRRSTYSQGNMEKFWGD